MTKRRSSATGILVGVRLQSSELRELDSWIAEQPEPRPSRPEALRRLAAAEIGAPPQTFLPGQALVLDRISAAEMLNLHPAPKLRISPELFDIVRDRRAGGVTFRRGQGS